MTRQDIERLARAGDITRQQRNHSRHSGPSARTAFFLVLCLLLLAVMATCAGASPAAGQLPVGGWNVQTFTRPVYAVRPAANGQCTLLARRDMWGWMTLTVRTACATASRNPASFSLRRTCRWYAIGNVKTWGPSCTRPMLVRA